MSDTYWAMIKGTGEGCDYTIGCNKKYEQIKADSWEDAKRKADEIVRSMGIGDGRPAAEEVVLVRVSEVYRPNCRSIQSQMRDALKEREKQEELERERKQFEKLKKKFGG